MNRMSGVRSKSGCEFKTEREKEAEKWWRFKEEEIKEKNKVSRCFEIECEEYPGRREYSYMPMIEYLNFMRIDPITSTAVLRLIEKRKEYERVV